MRKILIASVLALAAMSASAVELRLEAQDANGQNGTASQTVYELGVKQSINANFAGDLAVKQYRADTTNALANRVEAGLTGTMPLYSIINGYTRVAIGENYISGASGYSYYSVEPGVSAAIKYMPGTTVSLGYRYQDAFNSGHNDLTRTVRAKVGYDITKNNNVYIGYDSQRGDADQNITKIGYIHRF